MSAAAPSAMMLCMHVNQLWYLLLGSGNISRAGVLCSQGMGFMGFMGIFALLPFFLLRVIYLGAVALLTSCTMNAMHATIK
ncbi:hypothetical protein ACFX2F_025980 [Malus domestica]